MNSKETSTNRRRFVTSLPALGASLAIGGNAFAQGQDAAPATSAPAGKLFKIGLEEHFMIPAFLPYLADTKQNINPGLYSKAVKALSDFGASRLDVKRSIEDLTVAWADAAGKMATVQLAVRASSDPDQYKPTLEALAAMLRKYVSEIEAAIHR